jgi:3-phenylpropionate/trans-cinnamate dioxygenase ferredoxin reductase component
VSPGRVPYLIVGGGMAADAAVRGIRAVDPDHEILLVTAEPHPPYDRPPLSKGLWKGVDEDRIWRGTAEEGVTVRTRTRAVRLSPERREVLLEDGSVLSYRELLLATGASPARLGGDPEAVIHFRDLEDYRRLRGRAGDGASVGIAGAGFVATELASSLVGVGARAVMAFPEEAPLERILPAPLPERLARLFRARGVGLHPGVAVSEVVAGTGGLRLLGEGGAVADGLDVVVAGLGVRPAVGLAREAGLRVHDGVVVDERFSTSASGVHAAGDLVSFPLPLLGGRRVRVEHEDHANESGMLAGMAMAGAGQAYDPVPHFYSGFFDLTWEGLGLLEADRGPSLHLGERVDSPGAALYRKGGRLTGVLLWNAPGRARRARKLLREEPTLPEREALDRLGL